MPLSQSFPRRPAIEVARQGRFRSWPRACNQTSDALESPSPPINRPSHDIAQSSVDFKATPLLFRSPRESIARRQDGIEALPDDIIRASGATNQLSACINTRPGALNQPPGTVNWPPLPSNLAQPAAKCAIDALKSSSIDIKCVTTRILRRTNLVNRDQRAFDFAQLSIIAQK